MAASNYRILEQVGAGQFGRVYCAIEKATGTIVALKYLDQLSYPTKKFLREILYLVSLSHPNIVSFHGFEHHKKGRYLILDYCDGGTLRDLMDSQIQLSLCHRLKLVSDILSGLNHAHTRGIVHCDIKPENILLQVNASGGWTAKLTDFGIARLIEEANINRQSGGYTGSPAYMAPERFYGKYSYASDLYAIGILLYELIVGERPFSGLPGELMSAHMSQSVLIPDTVPPQLRSIIETALRKLPQRRFHNAGEMLNSLNLALKILPPVTTNSIYSPVAQLPSFSGYQVIFTKKIFGNFTTYSNNLLHLYSIQDNQVFREKIDISEKYITRFKFPHRIVRVESLQDRCWIWTGSNSQLFLYSCSSSLDVKLLAKFSYEAVFSEIKLHDQWLLVNQFQLFIAFKLPEMIAINTNRTIKKTVQLLWFDHRHGLAIYQEKDQTKLKLFNRRGHLLDALTLPCICHNFIINQFCPYFLICSESYQPSTLLIINLKPWRIKKLPLEIAPDFITSYGQGFILAYNSGLAIFFNIYTNRASSCFLSSSLKYISAIDQNKLIVINQDNWLQVINIETFSR